MANEPVPACTGPDLTHPDFATRLLREPDTAHRHALLSQALLRFLVRSGTLDDRADVETPAVLESLIAVELNVVLDARLGVETDLWTLRHPVCASDLAANVLDLMDGTAPPPTSQVLAHDTDGRFEPFALTDLQQAYLLGRGEFFALGSVPAAFYAEIDAESVDVERLEAAWNAVVARHDMLRAVFTEDGRQQVIAEAPAYRFARNDLRGAEPADRDDRLASIREEIAGKVRAPEQWPLFEIGTTRLDDRHTRIHIAVDLMIADAPSIRQLLGEWLAVDAGSDPGPVPEVTFRDYVLGLEAVEDSAGFRAARKYWLERLAELPPAPELPLRTPMESVAAAQFSSRSFELSGERWSRLRQRALAGGLTPSMVLCWAYAATLRTWSASDDFTLNVTVNDRLPVHPDIDRVIGEYTSQVLVAVDVDATNPVRDQIGMLQDRFWRDFEHRGFSGVQVLRELARSEGGTRTTMPYVFDAVLGQDLATADLPEWFRGIPYVAATAPQVALECQVFELGGVLRVNWAVVDELFPPGMIDAAFAAFGGLLERLADDEGLWEQRELGLTGPSELAARKAANATQGALPEGLLHELGGPLRARGNAPAVIAAERTLTYDELDRRAARIARKLRELGAEPNALVAVVMEKGWEQPVAALGVLQVGAAYLPIDATWPGDRIRHVLERGRCQIVLTQSQVSHAWPSDLTVLVVDDDAVWEGLDDSPVDCPAGPEDLAYVIFTSGSTGEPKGVMIDHRGAANTVADINNRYDVTATDRVLGLSSLSFDLSVWDIFGMLAAGGALVLPPSDAGRDPESWLQLMRQHRVSVWNTVPALMEMLAEHTTAARLETIDELRLVLMSGDWIPLSLPERIRACAPGAEIISLGGATEASIWSIHHPINQLDPTWPSIPYGQPLTNQTFHILSSHTLEPVPTWVPGELFIAGTGLAHGYWDDPHKTADRFLTHPTTKQPLYRTGDLGRYHPDGTIEFLGRNDHQVKINGYRIELGEIETQLTTHPTIKDALVTATNNHLTAYLIPDTDRDTEDDALRVTEWESVFDTMRSEVGAIGHDFDTTGWTSTYTGELIPDDSMRLWVDETVGRILESRPSRVLEIGCGTGLLATRLAPHAAYTGVDVSAETLATVRAYFDARPEYADRVDLLHRDARDLAGIEDGSVDCVVVNSVVQYFPSGAYLLDVLGEAARVLSDDGTLFVGDVRDLRLLRAFHTSVELFRTDPTDSADGLADRVAARAAQERELAISPQLFRGLRRLGFTEVSLRPKTGDAQTEMADYRYDAILRKSAPSAPPPSGAPGDVVILDGRSANVLAELTAVLEEPLPGTAAVTLRGVPNPRLVRDLGVQPPVGGFRPDDLRSAAAAAGWQLEARLTEVPHEVDVVLHRGDPTMYVTEASDSCSGQELENRLDRLVNRPAAPGATTRLRESVQRHVSEALPSYMLPERYVFLERFPLTANGKVDRGRLPAPGAEEEHGASHDYTRPRTLLEERLSAIWCDVLGSRDIGVHTDFFSAGGDSLLAVRTAGAASSGGLPLSASDVFARPTIAGQAEILAGREHGTEGAYSGLPIVLPDPAGRFEPFALTDLQQAYLLGRGGFFALGGGPAAFYAEIDAESLDVERVEASWNALVARHDMLRTIFTEDGSQRVLSEVPDCVFDREDVRGLAVEERAARLGAVRERISGRVREPERWPLFEIAATRLDEDHTRIHIAIDLLIADGTTLGRIVDEWGAHYRGGGDVPPVPGVSFRDYVRALEGVEDSAGFRASREYWLGRIAELPPAPELPLRVSPESVSAARFSSRSVELSQERWARLRQRALADGLTPSMVLCWAYAATLRTWSASDTFTLNVTVNDRLPVHPDIDRVLGEFTSVTLLAAELDATTTVREQARALQAQFWRDFEHRAFNGMHVLREIGRAGGAARASMPVVFTSALGDGQASLGRAAEEFGELTYHLTQTPQVYLDCQVFELGGALRVNWAVVDELFPPGMIDAAFASFGGLLERLADDEALWGKRELGLVGPDELAAREAANATQAVLPEGLLHELGGPLHARGETAAVIAPERTLSYAQLDSRAARIARKLRELGAEPNTLVAVVMEKGWEQPVAALGVLQSGAAYLPIDATWPGNRVRHILERGRCTVVLTQTALVDEVEWPTGLTVLAVDDDAVWEGLDDSPVDCPAGPEDLAYVIFTSGSTGEPKGVMIDHRGAANTVTDINKRYNITATDRVLGLSSLSFDLSVWDIFGIFAAGGAVVLPGPDAHRDPVAWAELLRVHRVTVWNTVPALMEMLAEHAGAQAKSLDPLRLVLLSGDWIPLSLPERIRACAPDAEIISLGGATEASIWSIHHPINQLDPTWPSIPYGQPLTNQTFHILSSHTLEPVPTWVPGELFIAGTGLAHGYWDDPHKTADRFLTHPTTKQPLYRTGDLGRYHPDGTIEFLGRNDHQVKINGYRIELGEIETQLTTHPTIKDALVTATNNHLTAYLIPADPGYAADPDTLIAGVRESLAAVLPDYMVPRSHVVLDALPLSANGKVDRAALPAPVPKSATHDSVAVDESGSEPRNDIERRLRVIWLDVLNIESVGIHDEFGELGGDSLLAVRVIGKAADAGLSLSPRQFFEHPTIAGLAGAATLVAPRTGSKPEAAVVGDVPLLPAQAMLLAGLDGRVARRHNYALLLELDDAMDKVALRVAVRTLVTRHDAFRTGFVHGPDGWVQRVEPADAIRSVPLEWIDIVELSDDEQDVSVEELAEAAQRSFDLAEPPLLRVLYFDRGSGRRPVLLLVAHWLAVDNFSLRLVLEELLTAHGQIAEEGQARLPAPTVSAARWAKELERHAERLGTVLPEHLPQAPARESAAVARDAVTVIDVLGAPAVAVLREQARGAATLGDVLLAALARSARAAGLGDAIRVDVDGHGRAAALPSDSEEAPAADLSRTVGRVSVRYELRVPAASDTEDGVRAAVAERSGHLNGGLDSAVARYGSRAHSGQAAVPAADFAFNYLGAVDELYAIPGLHPSTLRPGRLVHPDTPLRHRFELLCGTVDGELLIGVTTPGDGRAAGEHLLKCLIAELGGSQAEVETAHGERGQEPRGGRGSGLAGLFRRWLSPGTTE
ncbi:amino acid adenylation domain-containing protein [Streptomyces sp. NPDC086554]|uniref:amino acid adenylation domain-containing protein n=1 Tax=Streptomyces sp. NPDC086554 TaxID=3154864 RepID=UPI00341A32C4